MCGIVGLISKAPLEESALQAATTSLRHRGPDDAGHWRSQDQCILLGHRRLSIIDLSAAGHQPFTSADGRYTIVYNGEIYNFGELREALEVVGQAPEWRGHSDTEVLLAAIAAWGVDAALKRAAGMFALALWDRKEEQLTLARDRFGEKPLYYGWCAAGFAFASELKAIRALPGFDNPVDPAAVRQFLAFNSIPAPLSIYRGLFKLEPGAIVSVARGISSERGSAPLSAEARAGSRFRRYYDYAEVVLAGAADPIRSHHEALEAMRQTMLRAVGRQMVADVPVGTFLSGGIDSSLITALATRATATKVRTFSVGFADAGYDEAPDARAIAAHLGTDHNELYVSPAEAQAVIPLLPKMYDEPFADSSQLPTYLVSRFARSQVTVALSGDAGDELFGGYNRHREFPGLWRRIGGIPRPLRQLGLGAVAQLPAGLWNRAGKLATGRELPAFFGHKVRRALGIAAGAQSYGDLVSAFVDVWSDGAAPAHGPLDLTRQYELYARLAGLPLASQLMAVDALTYLPDTILTKVDRAAMAVSLEGRIPFLDPDVAAVAARIPIEMKIAGGKGKAIVRDLLYTMVPRELLDRPKAGFAMPVAPWLRGPLRDWAEDLLDETALADTGLLNPAPIRRRWAEHVSGRREHSESLWAVLMLQSWLREQAV